jgi:LmbE family N-acetylglucosaminyl deacetylase
LFVCNFYLIVSISAQTPAASSSEIYLGLQKLNTVCNVLYVAAHPDDENTLLIAYLSKEKKTRTAYMALTRGDGGQNLIGPEQNEYVGLLRTHELLEARKVDGGEQYFSRAIDFGYTKETQEAFMTWGKEKILEDLVLRIRIFKPDVIINRFPPDARAGHGHHSASAALSIEAFDAAADPNIFPDQVKKYGTWAPKRLVWNSYSRGFNNEAPSEGNYVKIPLGDFNPILGKSYPEIAAEARSKHRSQGFGSAPSRTERFDYALLIKGPKVSQDLFEDIDMSWNRVNGGAEIKTKIDEAVAKFDFLAPAKTTEKLLEIYKSIAALPENHFKAQKLKECLQLIMQCNGIYFEASAQQNTVSPGEQLRIFSNTVNRGALPVKLESISINGICSKDSSINKDLEYNKAFETAISLKIPSDAPISQPYWLKENPEKGIYTVNDTELRGTAMLASPLKAIFNFSVNGQALSFSQDIKYKYTEPSRGEIYKYLEVRPAIMANIDQKVYVFAENKSKNIQVSLKSNRANLSASVKLIVPPNWKVSPDKIDLNFKNKNQEIKVNFSLSPPLSESEASIAAEVQVGDQVLNRSIKTVSYEHIPELNVFPLAQAQVKKINLVKKGKNLAYIAGAGDEVPDALRQIGYDVKLLGEKDLSLNLNTFDAIIVGVRAYNTEDWLINAQDLLLDYVKQGGTLLVQYQTQAFYGSVKTKDLGPYPISIGRGRVTDENAEMKILDPKAPILNSPNRIKTKDFEGWVQERGLYFAEKWSDQYKTVFAIKDTGENEQEGSLLYASYGKGHYVFTSLAFFRQLPAGVSGAYRLMSNLISIGKK